MRVDKPLDLVLLQGELDAAGVAHRGLSTLGTDSGPDEVDLFTYDEEGRPTELPPEAGPVVDAHDATAKARTAAFEAAEDAERLRVINERSRTDPAYAALAEIVLKGAST